MITTCLQTFTHGRQARFLPSSGLLVQCAPRHPLLGGSREKFFRMLDLNVVGMVYVADVMYGGTPDPIGNEGKVDDVDGDSSTPKYMLVKMKLMTSKLVSKLLNKVSAEAVLLTLKSLANTLSMQLKSMVKPLVEMLTKALSMMSKLMSNPLAITRPKS